MSIFHLKSIGHAGECIYCTYIGVKLSINMMNTSTVASLYKVKSSSVLAEPDQDTKILLVSYYFEVTNRRLEHSIRVDDHNSINSNLSLLTIFSAEYHLPRTAPPLSRGPCKLILNNERRFLSIVYSSVLSSNVAVFQCEGEIPSFFETDKQRRDDGVQYCMYKSCKH